MAETDTRLRFVNDLSLLTKDLKSTHPLYQTNDQEWYFLQASYKGARELIRLGLLARHERESLKNYQRRIEEAFGFSYSASVVNLFNFYLFQKPVERDVGQLKGDELWEKFVKDCDLFGNSFDDYVVEQGRWASVFGHVGILVDKPQTETENVAQEKAKGIYPYLARYFPTAILDWEYKRAEDTNRPFLAYLKLIDDDGKYRLWYPDHWEIWEEASETEKEEFKNTQSKGVQTKIDNKATDEMKATFLDAEENPLGEVAFVWLYNMKSDTHPLGSSDITDIARVDLSIMRNLSQGEEIINFAAFPMMRKPMRESSLETTSAPQTDEVGETAVLEFNPEHGEDGKPDWLESKVAEPLTAIASWVDRKVDEIYRSSNSGGVASTQVQGMAKSGVALKTEFLLLNSRLANKAVNVENAEKKIIEFYLKWKNQEDWFAEVKNERAREYEVEDLAADLENILTAKSIVVSDRFNEAIQKSVVRKILVALTDEQYKEIDDEIKENIESEPELTPEEAFKIGVGAEGAEGPKPGEEGYEEGPEE